MVRQSSVPDVSRLKAIEDKLRKKEAALRERETYLREKELFLNQKEDELLERERTLIGQSEQKAAELHEKESLLNEILKCYELPQLAGDLKKALQTAMERTTQGSTCGCGISARNGSFSHTNNLRDSSYKKLLTCSDASSPLKSGNLALKANSSGFKEGQN